QANNNAIEWVTQGELAGGTFMVEQEVLDNKMWVWKELTEVDGKGNILRNQYSVSPRHLPGENKYRIRYQPPVGESEAIYSLEVVYTSTENPITFYPLVVTNKITFSESTDYSITDRNGKVVKQGTGKVLFVQEIRPGEYFLHFQNQTEKFVKK
ncbi:MAG: hypothetical protein OEY51_11835, partial [Cyclobacteriaceae bacterium]|nr:hypothetical protein [Cyclobacteriaceae bacterium]